MSSTPPGSLVRLLRWLWRAVDATRRFVLNVVFLLVVLLLAIAWVAGSSHPRVLARTTLVADVKGKVVEQFTGSAREAELAESLGGEPRETQLRDLVEAIDAAAADPRIERLVLALDDMGGAGIVKLREIARAVDRFKAGGKQVVAWASSMDEPRYLLAAHASEVYLHPMGAVWLRGFGGYRNYYRDALDRLGVTVNVYRVGKFKSAVEPFTGNGPSPESAQADAAWLGDAWRSYTREVEAARGLAAGAVDQLIAEEPARLAAADGDLAALALREKLVDGLKTRDEMRALLLARGVADAEHKSFRQIGFEEYHEQVGEPGDSDRQVGIIVAEGEIADGEEAQGAIGGRSTSQLIRKAREDATVKALVLRVDSPGGSAFGSELIRRELELTRKAGKPVVVSMSDVAASGGYWISTAADRVLADAATITGSIGVFSLLPTVDRGMEKLGIHTGGTTTTWLAGAPDLRRPIDPRLASILQSQTEHVYREFLAHVAQAHGSTPDRVHEVAQGRIWTGAQALERQLVDGLGGLDAAVHEAAARAHLAEGYRVTYLEAEPKGWVRMLASLPSMALQWLAREPAGELGRAWSEAAGSAFDQDAALLATAFGPGGRPKVLARCLCSAP